MTTQFIATTSHGALRPVDQTGQDMLAGLKPGQEVVVTVKRARNLKQLRKYWKLIAIIHPQQSRYPTEKKLSDMIKTSLGFCEETPLKDGRIMVQPDSLAFESMPQAEFDIFFNRVIDLVVTRILPGVKEEDLRRELEEMVR